MYPNATGDSSRIRYTALTKRAVIAIVAILALFFTGLSAMQARAADAPPSGSYSGTSTAYTGATVQFSIDGDGNMSGFSTTSYCTTGFGVTPIEWADMPPTPVQAGESFDLRWETGSGSVTAYYELKGVVNADGTASGTGRAGFLPSGTCGGMNFTWSASGGDPVVVEPVVSVVPGELSVSELAAGGVTVSGSGFLGGADVVLRVAGSDVDSAVADGEGAVSFVFSSSSLGAGSYSVELVSAAGSGSGSFVVTEDPIIIDPTDPIPSTTPAIEDLDDSLQNAISAPATARAGDSIPVLIENGQSGARVGAWLFSTPTYLGTQVISADGSITVRIPETATLGEHTLAVWAESGEQLGWTTIAVVAPSQPAPGDGSGDGTAPDDDAAPADGSAQGGQSTLPATGGGDALPLAGIALSLLLLAVGAFAMARRRTQREA